AAVGRRADAGRQADRGRRLAQPRRGHDRGRAGEDAGVAMARKVCPSCKQVNAASATGCAKCGHAFDMSLVKAATRARRCPMCGMVSPSSVKSCESCHYDFDDDQQDLEPFLKHRVSIGRWTAGAGVLVMLLAVPMLF